MYKRQELKQMVSEVVMSVLADNSNRHITIQAPAPEKGSKVSAKTEAADKPKKEPKKRTPRKSVAAGKKTEQASGCLLYTSRTSSLFAWSVLCNVYIASLDYPSVCRFFYSGRVKCLLPS